MTLFSGMDSSLGHSQIVNWRREIQSPTLGAHMAMPPFAVHHIPLAQLLQYLVPLEVTLLAFRNS
ncbi:hypothetical protein COLO4_12178 [Corchorus olitorius]|uniref:Uncharacterized protein n=1 Tax=Corchorus olitorius TaxID=93759 RepID=A0A1R3K1W0_9ROSI|nr:hypothetical protein COLO4_12178 [Corchorus olitorius]